MEDDVTTDARPEPAHLSRELAMMLDRANQLLGLTWPAQPTVSGEVH